MRLQLTATYRDGHLLLTTAAGAHHSTLALDDVDDVEALELLDAGHDVGRWPFASPDDLDVVLARHGWSRVQDWALDGDGLRALVRASAAGAEGR